MTTDVTLGKFLTLTYTKREALKRLRLIRHFLDFKIYSLKEEKDFKKLIEAYSKKDPEADKQFILELGDEFFNAFVPAEADTQIKELEAGIEKIKTVTLYTPFEIPQIDVERMGSWLKKTVGTSALFDLEFDPNLIGGCALSYNGIYKDYSLRKRLEDNKTEVLNMLTGFKK